MVTEKKYHLADCSEHWWLAYVMGKNEELKVTFLHRQGPSASFSFPKKPYIQWIPIMDVLCIVDSLVEVACNCS